MAFRILGLTFGKKESAPAEKSAPTYVVLRTMKPKMAFAELGLLLQGADITEGGGVFVASLCEYRVSEGGATYLRENGISPSSEGNITVILRECGIVFYRDFERACENPLDLNNLA